MSTKQSSSEQSGTLYVVATPIGNLEDVSRRALQILAAVDLVLAEDTRRTRKLLSRYEIHTRVRAFHEHNEDAFAPDLIARMLEGAQLALVSDAGTPAISDPGYPLVRGAIEAGLRVVPIPGPSAVLAALTASGLPTSRFLFAGYLPRRRSARISTLRELQGEPGTLIFLESPRRLARSLADAAEVLGERPVAVARELTKVHEEFVRGSLSQVAATFADRSLRGEVTVCIAGADTKRRTRDESCEDRDAVSVLEARFEALLAQGLERNEAVKVIARETGISRQEVYRTLIIGERGRAGSDQEEKN